MFPTVTTIPLRLLWLMALACGVSVANVYYNQPLLRVFSLYFHASAWQAGLVATASQTGYGLGLLLFLPLGDVLDRQKLIVVLIFACLVFLLVAACATSLPLLIGAQFLVALCAISPQILIPLGTELVPANQRGHLVGFLMGGLLCGILLARVFSGLVSDLLGWRMVYVIAAGLMLLLGLGLRSRLPHRPPTLKISYGRLMHSLLVLLETQPELRIASLVSALSFGAFSAFWTTLSFLMAEVFHRGATEAGLFGIIGLMGAFGAPWAGKLSDRRGSAFTLKLALVLMVLAFVIMWSWVSIPGLVLGVLIMDLGAQSIQVAAQTKVISLVPEARSRLNTLYMVTRFSGGAAGSISGATLWSAYKWNGVCGGCIVVLMSALLIQVVAARRGGRQDCSLPLTHSPPLKPRLPHSRRAQGGFDHFNRPILMVAVASVPAMPISRI